MNLTEKEILEIYADLKKIHDKELKEWEKTKKKFKNLVHPKYIDFIEDHEYSKSIGIVNIATFLTSDGSLDICKEIGNSTITYTRVDTTLDTIDGNSKYEGDPITYWVYQESGYLGDSYSGYLLIPLLNGSYWKIYFNI